MKMNPNVFRLYDIRGIAGSGFSPEEIAKYEQWYGPFPGITLTPEASEAIGKAYGTIIRKAGGSRVAVGYELRPFAEELFEAFVRGVRSTGCTVLDAGISLTPVIYFAVAAFGIDGGVNITGSHNVYFYNGFKLMKRGVWPLYGQELQVLRGIVEREEFATAPPGGREKLDAYGEYRSYFLAHTRFAKNMRIVLDTGNGSAGIFAPKLFREAGCEVIELYCEPDATFPNHDPDPEAPQNMRDLGEQVRQRQADFGIALDADGDRAGFVDEQGAFVSADLSLLLFAKDALSRNPGRKILFDVKSTQLLQELVPRYGGVPLMHQTGHAPIKETLRRDEAIIFGGEVSGHFYFVEDYFRIDDGMFAAAKMLELASRHPGSFSSLFSEFPHRVRTPEIKLPCEDEKKFEIVEKIKKDLEGLYPGITIDGLRFQVSDTGWGLIRASNTSPYLTVRVEGASEEEVLKIKGILADELKKVPGIPDSLNREKVAALEGKLGWL